MLPGSYPRLGSIRSNDGLNGYPDSLIRAQPVAAHLSTPSIVCLFIRSRTSDIPMVNGRFLHPLDMNRPSFTPFLFDSIKRTSRRLLDGLIYPRDFLHGFSLDAQILHLLCQCHRRVGFLRHGWNSTSSLAC